MSAEVPIQKTKVVFKRENKTVHVSMFGDFMIFRFSAWIRRKGDSLFYDFYGTKEIKGNLYDLINESVEDHFRRMNNDSREFKLLSFAKPEGDILDIVKDVFCNGQESSLLVEYEFHWLDEDLFDCKDCG